MKKRINIHWAIGLIVVTVVLAVGGRLLLVYQRGRHAGFFLNKARAAAHQVESLVVDLKEGENTQTGEEREQKFDALADEFEQASDFYDRYVALDRGDVEGLAEYGMFLADHAPKKAYTMLEEVLREDGSRADVRRKAAETAVAIRRYRDAREHLEKHLLQESPEDVELLGLLAACQIATGEHQAAVDTLGEAIRLDPTQLDLCVRRASLLSRELKQADAAEECMNALVEANPQNPLAHVHLGNFLVSCKRYDDATQEADTALDLDPDSAEALVLSMQCSLASDDFGNARERAVRVLELAPNRFETYEALSQIEIKSGEGGIDQALTWLRQGVEQTAGHPFLVSRLADLLLTTGELEEASKWMDALKGKGAHPAICMYLEGRREFEQEHWLAAKEAFEIARPELPPGYPVSSKEVDFWLAKCFKQLGDYENEKSVSERTITASPEYVPARLVRAQAMARTGKLDEALAEYDRILELDNAPRSAWVERARWMIVNTSRKDKRDRDWTVADRMLRQMVQRWPDDQGVVLLLGRVLTEQGKVNEAFRTIQAALEGDPDSTRLQLGLAEILENQSKWEEAGRIYAEIEKTSGDSVSLRLARARYAVKSNKGHAADLLPTFAENTTPFTEPDLLKLWNGLAAQAAAAEAWDFAQTMWEEIAEHSPNDLTVRLRLLNRAFLDRDLSQVDKYLEEIRKIEGKGPHWHFGQAQRLILLAKDEPSSGLLDRAQQHAGEVQTLRPGWADGEKLAARIAEMKGDEVAAIQGLQSALESGDEDSDTVQTLTRLLCRQGRYEEADRLLQRYGDRLTFSGELGRLAAELSMRANDADRGLEIARATAGESSDAADRVWLAGMLERAIRDANEKEQADRVASLRKEAEAALRSAIELDGSSPDAWLQLIRFLVDNGDPDAAASLVDEIRVSQASKKAPGLLPLCYEALGVTDKADELFASLATARDAVVIRQLAMYQVRRGNAKAAESALKRFLNRDLDTTVEDQMWARRTLATLQGQQDVNVESPQAALDLIEENLAIKPDSVPDLRAKAYVLASSKVLSEREEALKLLTDLVSDPQGSAAPDRFQLAQLHARLGHTSEAREQLRSLLAIDGDNTSYLSLHAALLLDDNELSEAEIWLKRLEKLAPQDLGTKLLRSELLFSRNELNSCREMLLAESENLDVQTPAGGSSVFRIARQLESFGDRLKENNRADEAVGFIDDAEKLYRRYFAQRSDQRLPLAHFLGRQGRHKEAIQVLEESWETSSPDAVALACDPLVRDTLLADSELKRIEVVLQKCLKKNPDRYLLLLVMSELHITQKEYDQAEAIYKRMRQRNQQDLAAINNLAMLRALRGRDLDTALKEIGEAIDSYGSMPQLLDTRAVLHLAKGDARKALADLKIAGAKGTSASLYFHLAQTYLKLGEEESASEAFEQAAKMGLAPGNLKGLHQLERGMYEEIRRALN